ncbi:hypothetical protein LEP1GSC137_4564, partial [Leptospira borgpetersenii str. Noumea 25]
MGLEAGLRTLGSRSYYNFKRREKTANATVSVETLTFRGLRTES